ncbi:glycosyltransferase [Phyllobacterium sp. 628]|uniref:glycosyltransferase n=1 Tax=Phyllobacterium sp. 628 TaxID=2718938 RepID=UPI001662473F|nr:glycosyltransferase [Phyllobacterium sp. 628]QND51855.1 glycosyltransferase [Phyllobacterium sp. 628]
MLHREIEARLAARFYDAGLPKALIQRAFKQSISNKTSFIDELYASACDDEAMIGRCIADEVGLVFADIPDAAEVVLSGDFSIAALRHTRHVRVLASDENALIYVVPTIDDIVTLKDRLPTAADIAARMRITTPSRLFELLASSHAKRLIDGAVRMVEDSNQIYSAKVVLTGRQGVLVGILLVCLLLTIFGKQQLLWESLHILFSVFFFACVFMRILAGRRARGRLTRPLPNISVGELPVYTVMIALYREAEIVPQLIDAVTRLNWPQSKLQVLLLCESDDHPTLDALRCEPLPYGFSVVPISGPGPRTKPRALNYGLQLARGDLLVVYDAEDRPHPDQLLEAFHYFSANDGKLGCLQAPLMITNPHESVISRLFAFEYAAHFHGFLPWLAQHRLVLPLGGSSNHFRYECLVEAGGWDPYNVTEDAELGTRLARHGYRTDMISLPTVEDAPTEIDVWFRQRTRWFKGWMQTWLVQMRQPGILLRQFGIWRFLVYHLLAAGMIISALLYPVTLAFLVTAAVYWLIGSNVLILRPNIIAIDLINIIVGYWSYHILGSRALAGRPMHGAVLLWIPFYWLLMSFAAWRAIWQLNKAPFLWEKTPHRPSKSRS